MKKPNKQYTPGPWIETIADGIGPYKISNGNSVVVSGPMSHSDAALIAAAPEMLQELEENIQAIRDLYKDEHREISWDELDGLLTNILNDNLRVIKKAKGEI